MKTKTTPTRGHGKDVRNFDWFHFTRRLCVCGGEAVPVPARIHQSHISQMFQTTRKQNLRGTNNFSSSVTVPFSPHSSEMSSTAVELDIICNWFKQTILLSLHSFLFTVHYCTYRYKSINCECSSCRGGPRWWRGCWFYVKTFCTEAGSRLSDQMSECCTVHRDWSRPTTCTLAAWQYVIYMFGATVESLCTICHLQSSFSNKTGFMWFLILLFIFVFNKNNY